MSTWRRHRAQRNIRASSIAAPGGEGWTIRDHRAILRSEPYASADLGAASDVTAKSILSEAAPVSPAPAISPQRHNAVIAPAHGDGTPDRQLGSTSWAGSPGRFSACSGALRRSRQDLICTIYPHFSVAANSYFFLGAKAGGEAFTDADEEVLVLFASQAAAAIANARTHRGEQRARRNLEALIETSPVGVVVFDRDSGRMVSYNREARRIVECLRMPGRPLEELLGTIVCRRADGREVSLAELPLAQQLASAETVRAEEVVLSVPDGRSVRTLINATPIEAEGPVPGSVVVTMQDLAPLDEVERLRTEFLGLVSHELRAPLSAIKGAGVTLMEEPAGLDPVEMREFFRVIVEQADQMRSLIADLLDTGRIDSGTLSVSPEPSAVADLVEGARSAFLAGDNRHGLVVDLAADLPPVIADRRRIVQVLNNLLANAARHTPASSVIRVAAVRDERHVAISVADDGEGVEPGLLPHLFRRNVGGAGGTASQGLGLAICKGLVEAHGGRIRAASDGPGEGTTITFTIPAAAEPGKRSSAKPHERARIHGARNSCLAAAQRPSPGAFGVSFSPSLRSPPPAPRTTMPAPVARGAR